MEPHGRSPASAVRHPDPGTGLEDSMWNLGLGGGGGGGGLQYPERPGEPDCSYYMRTGLCGYGERCRYNHPRYTGKVTGAARTAAAENPEPGGQPACLYFLKNGICKYGSTCKYDHRIQGIGSVHPVSFNYLGYPLRPGEKDCSYYMRMGQCKFGPTCRFHHPQPPGASMPLSTPAYYPMMQYPSVPSPHHYQTFDAARPSVVPAPYIQGPYGPMLLSPGVVPFVGWSPYPPPASPVVPPGGQHSIQEGSLYGSSNQLSLSAPAYPGPYPTASSSARPSSNSQKELMFPERPGQPECQYYMRTGHCKFSSACKYHHPPERSMPENNLSPIGLPLRPGAPHCAFYSQHGKCKYGSACKFDHPMGNLSYSPSASSLPDMPIAPYPIGSPLAALAPSSSSSALSSEFSSSNSISMDHGSRISSSS